MLTSLQNPLVKQMRKLHRSKTRREMGLFLLEGTHLLEEARSVGFPVETVCCTPEWRDRHPAFWSYLEHRAQRLELVSEAVLEAIATTVSPDGIVATAPRQSPRAIPSAPTLGLALETLQDPGNLGTIIRTAAGAGVDSLWVTQDSVDLENPKVLRSTAGQWFRLPMAVTSDLPAQLRQCKAMGMQVLATLPTATATYWEVDLTRPTLFLLGNEGAGLSEDVTALADFGVKIPLASGVESLNVAIAAGLLVYEAQRQRAKASLL